jgi:hypothetical protein
VILGLILIFLIILILAYLFSDFISFAACLLTHKGLFSVCVFFFVFSFILPYYTLYLIKDLGF